MASRNLTAKGKSPIIYSSPSDPGIMERPKFIKIEKSLISLFFFTPTSKRIKDIDEKVLKLKVAFEGKQLESTVRILPSAVYGLPNTDDQDKFFALQEIITQLRRQGQRVENPIAFTTPQLYDVLGKVGRRGGRAYTDIDEWLNVMKSTTVISRDAVFLAGRKKYVSDRFSVFDRAVTVGSVLDDGSIADKNYIWLSEWQLENINANYLLPLNFQIYKKLKNRIAKALIPILQIAFYATAGASTPIREGRYEKLYLDLCQCLGIRVYRFPAQVKEQLAPSLEELVEYGFLSRWSIEVAADGQQFKIVFYPGSNFKRDRAPRLEQKAGTPAGVLLEHNAVIKELLSFGFMLKDAERLVNDHSIEIVLKQVADFRIYSQKQAVRNPTGFLRTAIEKGWDLSDPGKPARSSGQVALPFTEITEEEKSAWIQYIDSEAEARVSKMRADEYARARKVVLATSDYYAVSNFNSNADRETAIRKHIVADQRDQLMHDIGILKFLALQREQTS